MEAVARLPGTAPHVAGRHALVGHSCRGTAEMPIANLCQRSARKGWGCSGKIGPFMALIREKIINIICVCLQLYMYILKMHNINK